MDARAILGVGPTASDEEIRTAYVQRVKEHPPDRSPAEFERIRDAYETLRNPRKRMQNLLFSVDPSEPFTSLISRDQPRHRYVGLGPWLEVLKGK